MDATAPRKKRSKSGCLTCRARKVKCDGGEGTCLNCKRLGLTCTSARAGDSHETDQIIPVDTDSRGRQVSVKRKRTFRSCNECKASKTRCSGERPVCAKCHGKSSQCTYEDTSEPVWQQQLKFVVSQQSQSVQDNSNNPTSTADQAENTIQQHSEGPATPEQSTNRRINTHWLTSQHLPENAVHALVECYFANVHPLRCFGFLHKPSFMLRLDLEDTNMREGDCLLLIVCALGALFYAAESGTIGSECLSAGSGWAKRSQQLILAEVDTICVENLMAAILLHDYQLRLGNFSSAFMFSGLTARMAQALQINLEHSTDILCKDIEAGPDASVKESRRRLMWCCYISDTLCGSGVDQLTLIKDEDIKIQLPCTERSFLLQTPCITEIMEPGRFLKFIPKSMLPSSPQDNMGIRACYLRYIPTRRKVLKYIKHLNVAKQPWLPDSEFAQIDAESRAWYSALPTTLHFTPNAIYIRKETSQLGALVALHYMYHQNMIDFYRIGAPRLYKLRSPFNFPPEQAGFLSYLQDELFYNARRLAVITAEALRFGPHALADSSVPTMVYDCCRVMLYYLTQLIDPTAERSKALMAETIPLVRSNVTALKMMRSMYKVAELLSRAAERMLDKVGIGSEATPAGRPIIPYEPYPNEDTEGTERSAPGTPVQSAPDYVLNPLSIYRMARNSIPEKHAPERQPNASSPIRATATVDAPTGQGAPQHALYQANDSTATIPATNPHDQTAFDDLLTLFTTDPSGWTWQPSDTAIGSQMESNGLPPWEPRYADQQLDAWLPMFSQSQQYGY